MFHISNNGIITVTTGDDFSIPIFININNIWVPLRYVLYHFDLLFFAIMEPGQQFTDAIVRKKFTKADFDPNKDVVVTISHEDTEYLQPGTYTYEIKVVTIDVKTGKEKVSTIFPKHKLFLLE